MKTKLFFSLVIFLTVAAFIFEKGSENVNNTLLTHPPPPVSTDSEFLINVMHSGIDYDYSEYPDLNTNAWHIYCGTTGGWPDVLSDNISTPPETYGPYLLDKIAENRSHGFRSIMERPRTVHLGWSQRSDYQCENVAVGADYWFYAYNIHQTGYDIYDNEFNGNGARVKYCHTNSSNPGINAGYVVKELRANREQANKQWTFMQRDDSYEWFVMPRIRIDTSVVNTSPNTKVCAIIMLDWNGDRIDSVEILAINFKNSSNPYFGNYLEEYYFSQPNGPKSAIKIDTPKICPGPAKYFWDWRSTNNTNTIKTDFRVYWYGLCDMWIDYVRVENKPAHEFFNPEFDWDDDVRAEADFALSGYNPDNPIPNNFYLEEFEFNMVPSIKHFNELVRDQTQNKISMMVNLNYSLFKVHLPPNSFSTEFSPEEIDRYLISRANIKSIAQGAYPLEGFEQNDTNSGPGRESYHPTTLSTQPYSKNDGILSYPASISSYEDNLQDKFDFQPAGIAGFITALKKAEALTQIVNDLNIIVLAQTHLHYISSHKLKEPSNEELNVMANISITYGAKGIMWFAYNSDNPFNSNYYQRGMTDLDLTPREQSVYGQNKWDGVKQINTTLKKWSPYIMNFKNEDRKSYIYHLENERNAMLNGRHYIHEAFTYKPQIDGNVESISDPINERYLQIAFFDKYPYFDPPPYPKSKYFMVVNRRCSPYVNNSSPDNIGGKRNVKIKIHPFNLGFTNFRNVSLIDVGRDSMLTTFYNQLNVNYTTIIDLGWFEPGEGKIFRVSPAMCVGGSLVASELDIINENFICEGLVKTDGYDVLIANNTTISFTSNGKIEADGGTFGCLADHQPIILKGFNGQNWQGLSLINCNSAFINTIFENVSGYAINAVNSNVGADRCLFNINSGAIRINNTEKPQSIDAWLVNNEFNVSNASPVTVNLNGSGGYALDVFIDGNEFNSSNGSAAILVNTATGTIKNNKINQYAYSIFSNNSSIDLYNNEINSSLANSIGVNATAMSHVNLGINGSGYLTGGTNKIYNLATTSKNLKVDNSFFNIHKGYNIFSIPNESILLSQHLSGSFPDLGEDEGYPTIYARYNCFKLNENIDNARHNVIWHNTNIPVEFYLTPYSCAIPPVEDGIISESDDGLIDTIMMISNYESEQLSLDQTLYDSLCIDVRKKEYDEVVNTSMELISLYADSITSNDKTLDAISKLYFASLELDSVGNQIEITKSFFENIILNYPENTELIAKLFYYIQKSKVILENYQSAMDGFQQIMNQSPYSYEALTASWDYDATNLLDTTTGSGGGIRDLGLRSVESESNNDFNIYLQDDPKDKYDSKVFTKENRKVMRQNVFNSLETSREKAIDKINNLEKKVSLGMANINEKRELEIRKALKNLSKPKKPKDISEYINNVNNDVNEILGVNNNSFEINDNLIPIEFRLNQNYPNPFNPKTKISFELPNDSKVKLVVYDLLGREVKTIVNSNLSIGRYEFIFDGSNFASGIYFYRIEAVQSNGEKFVESKRMVLIK